MKRVLDAVDSLIGGIVGTLFIVALVLSVLGVAGRYLSARLQLDWIGEVVIFLVIWALLLGAVRITRRGLHIRVDVLINALPSYLRTAAEVLSLLFALAVGALLVWSGWQVVEEAQRWDDRTVSTLRLPLWIYYTALPVSFTLQLIFTLERIVAFLTGQATHPTHDLTE